MVIATFQAFMGGDVPPCFRSREFFELLHRKLRPGGVAAVNSWGYGDASAAFAAVWRDRGEAAVEVGNSAPLSKFTRF